MRHSIRPRLTPRGATPRRLVAAKTALKRERDRHALFADQVAAEQESPEDRIVRLDGELLEQEQGHRDLAARHWKWGRRQLEQISEDTRNEILDKWNRSWIPPTAAYFADFVRSELKGRGISVLDEAAQD